MLATNAEGRNIITIEGLSHDGALDPVQQAFLKHQAFQCGYCTPGMIMAVKGLLASNPHPTEEQTRDYLSGNLCRCGTYVEVLAAVKELARECIKISMIECRAFCERGLIGQKIERRSAMASSVRIYAGTQEGLFVWRSKNGAWENVAVSFKTGTIDSIDGLRSRPNVVYLGVTQDGLYRTDDAGKNWRRVFEGNVRA